MLLGGEPEWYGLGLARGGAGRSKEVWAGSRHGRMNLDLIINFRQQPSQTQFTVSNASDYDSDSYELDDFLAPDDVATMIFL